MKRFQARSGFQHRRFGRSSGGRPPVLSPLGFPPSAENQAPSGSENCRKPFLPAITKTIVLAFFVFFSLSLSPRFLLAADTQEPSVNYIFRDSFYLPPVVKLKYDIYETNGFLLVRDHKRGFGSEFSVVTDFQNPMLESRILKNIRTIEDVNAFLEKNSRKIFFERVPIKELPLIQKDGTLAPRFWVGQKAFESLVQAKKEIAETKSVIEAGGGNFDRALELVTEFFAEEAPAPTPAEVRANYLAEEDLAMKMMDWLDVGEELYGPFTGTAWSERIMWQSFGETTFRTTNLDRGGFDAQVGYWTNRIVFKGIRVLGEPTLDPYVEVTTALESNGKDFPSHLDLIAGLEYRPFGRSAFFYNFDLGGLPLLRFARNYRLFVQYMERKNLKDEITGSPDTDLWAGVDVFYEWGLDLDPAWARPVRHRLTDWIYDYSWGEYYGTYRWEKTDFSTVDSFNAWVFNSSVIFGIKVPIMRLPPNPINDELELMPYLRLEHVTNPRRVNLDFQNRAFLAAGVRWMPFRSYQFENNEWLFKTKFFAEYVAAVVYPGASSPGVPNRDWRIGINVSYKRS